MSVGISVNHMSEKCACILLKFSAFSGILSICDYYTKMLGSYFHRAYLYVNLDFWEKYVSIQ